jgi:hypothetical protein
VSRLCQIHSSSGQLKSVGWQWFKKVPPLPSCLPVGTPAAAIPNPPPVPGRSSGPTAAGTWGPLTCPCRSPAAQAWCRTGNQWLYNSLNAADSSVCAYNGWGPTFALPNLNSSIEYPTVGTTSSAGWSVSAWMMVVLPDPVNPTMMKEDLGCSGRQQAVQTTP